MKTRSLLLVLAFAGLPACRESGPPPPSRGIVAGLPADGEPLFRFLLAEIPEVVAEVPCSCCGRKLAECYRGACPPSCRPCNDIGRDVYGWHVEGVPTNEIVARVEAKYFGRR